MRNVCIVQKQILNMKKFLKYVLIPAREKDVKDEPYLLWVPGIMGIKPNLKFI